MQIFIFSAKILFADNAYVSTLTKTLKNLELFDMDEIYNEFYQKVEELHDLLKYGEVRKLRSKILFSTFFRICTPTKAD